MTRDDLTREELTRLQGERLAALLREVLPGNRFYARKFAAAGLDPASVRSAADLARLPFTTKAELLADQAAHPPYGTALTYPLERYRRLLQTSGTSGRPLRWLDTPESWAWMLDCWAADLSHARRPARRTAVLPVLVRAVPRLLDGLRRGVARAAASACPAAA